MPKLTGPLFGVVEGEVLPRTLEAGTECPPELLAAAQVQGLLESEEAGASEAGERKPPKGKGKGLTAPEVAADPAAPEASA